MNKTLLTGILALLLPGAVKDAAAADDTAAIDARIQTTLVEIRRLGAEVVRLRAELASASPSVAPAPGRGGTAQDSAAPTPGRVPRSPGGTPISSDVTGDGSDAGSVLSDIEAAYAAAESSLEFLYVQLIARIAVAEQKLAQLHQQMASLLRARLAARPTRSASRTRS